MDFYILDKKEELVTILNDGEVGEGVVISANINEKLESYELLNIVIKADSEEASLVEEEYSIVFKDFTGWKEYTIYEIEDEDGKEFTSTIRAELSSSELIDDIVEINLAGKSKDPEIILEGILINTRWKVGNVDSSIYNSSFNVNTSYMGALEAITELANSFSCEVRFSYQIDGNKVINRFVDLYKQFGEDKGKRFEVDKDVNSIKRTVNTENIKTAIIPFSKEITETNEETNEVSTYTLDISDVEWKVSNGDPVDKPLGQKWLGDPIALNNWGRLNSNGSKRHRFMTMEFDLENTSAITSMAWVQLGRYTKPTSTYEVDAVDLFAQSNGSEEYNHEKTSLGDVVVAIDNYFAKPIQVQTRVVELERNLLDPRNNKYVFGSSKPIFSVNTAIEVAEEVAKDIDTVLEGMSNVQKNLNGKNRVFRGSATPVGMMENDIWFRPHPSVSGENQMVVYNGASWEIKADTSELQDAGRLQFGTIDGAEVNVINLTADNITGGNLSLANGLKLTNGNRVILGVNNSTGEVELNVVKLTVNASPVLTQEDLESLELKDGKSAYELAVKNGFKGTEAEWIKSLKGETGVGVDTALVTYQNHSSGTITPTGSWTPSPSPIKGTYLWAKTITKYTDGKEIPTYNVSYSATDGQKGDKGADGSNGTGIQSTEVRYNQSISGTVTPTTTWATTPPTPIQGQYNWTRTIINYTDGTKSTAYSTSYNATDGQKGDKGDTGVKGDNAPIVKLSGATQIIQVAENGTRIPSSSFTVVGVGVNTTISSWKYSVNGGSFTTTIPAGVTRSGNTVTVNPNTITFKTLSIQVSDGTVSDTFTVARTVDGTSGIDGTNGTNGTNGLDAITVVLTNESHTFSGGITNAIAGSTTTDFLAYKGSTRLPVTVGTITGMPTGMTVATTNNGATNARVTINVKASMTSVGGALTIPLTIDGKSIIKRFSYALALKGATGATGSTGAQGIQGEKGVAGATYYTWIKYADSPTSGMNDSPSNKAYIGIAYNKNTATKSTVYSDYQWALIKGVNGSNGVDGKTTYTWIKYAETQTGGNMSDTPEGKRYLGIAYNKTTSNESSNPNDYSWSPLYDNVIPGSVNLFRNSGRKVVKTSYLVNSYYMNEKMVAGQVYTLTLKADIATSQTQLGFYLNGSTTSLGVATRLTGTNLYSLTFVGKSSTATNDFVNVYNVPSNTSTATIHWSVLTKGNVGETDWVPATTDIVSPDNVVSAINLSAEEIKISGDKIVLDGHTEVDGSFKVSGDSIVDGTLTADQINGGSMNAKHFQLTDDEGNVVMSFDSANRSIRFNIDYMEIVSGNYRSIIGRDPKDSNPVYYTWTKTAYSSNDSVLYDSIGDRTWIGYAYNKLTSVESTNPNAYSWQPLYSNWYDSKGMKLPDTPARFANYPDYWAGFNMG